MPTEKASLLQVINPPIYLISVLPGVCVWLLHPEIASLSILITATFAVVMLQHGINLHNDVTDWHRGTDVDKQLSWARYYAGHTQTLMKQTYISLLIGTLLGLYCIFLSKQFAILFLATPLVLAGYFYNAGKIPLSYTKAGEWVTAICYGPGVFGCLWWLTSKTISVEIVVGGIIGSIAFAALAAAILLSHQPAQIETDSAANKISYAVRHGAARTYFMSRLLFVVFGLALLMLNLIHGTDKINLFMIFTGTVATVLFLLKFTPCPPKILMPAAFIICANVILSIFTR